MNADMLKKGGVDYERGVKRFMGRAQLYEKALCKFPRDTTFERIRAAYTAGDNAQLLADAHELKGVCGNIALPSLFTAADTLVTLLRGETVPQAALDAAYTRLEEEYHSVIEAILAAMEVE